MTTMPERVSKLEGAYEQVDQRLGELSVQLNAMDSKFESKFNTLIIVMATSGVAIVGTLIAIALRL
ncbi:MAG: hypothetical protein OXC83_06020 [Chloroflexi bacterium]|nr:hypothetical protein [Chloroflexota bacterium]